MSINFRPLVHRSFAFITIVAVNLAVTFSIQVKRGVNEDSQTLAGDFGQVNSVYIANFLKQPTSQQASKNFWGAVFFANCWHFALSLTYVLFNFVITKILTGVEWSRFGSKHATLRTSRPKGCQRSTYYLSLPYKYSVPLNVLLSSLHWLISQSVFLAEAHAFSPTGQREPGWDSSRVGYSLLGIILSLSVGTGSQLLFWPTIAWPKVTFRLPVVTTSSAAISA
jgi:hypothetical protein